MVLLLALASCAEPEDVADAEPDATVEVSACGWRFADPGDLASSGDVVEDFALATSCGDSASIWDAYGEYHILFLTAVW